MREFKQRFLHKRFLPSRKSQLYSLSLNPVKPALATTLKIQKRPRKHSTRLVLFQAAANSKKEDIRPTDPHTNTQKACTRRRTHKASKYTWSLRSPSYFNAPLMSAGENRKETLGALDPHPATFKKPDEPAAALSRYRTGSAREVIIEWRDEWATHGRGYEQKE